MKLLHTSDWHLGKMIYGRSLLPDQEHFIDNVFLPAVLRERPDCVLLSGDIYDRPVAPAKAIRLFDRVLVTLSEEMKIPIAIITGNHDGADRVALAAPLLKNKGVYLAAKLEDAFSPVTLEKDGERVTLTLLPYFEPEAARVYFGAPELRGFAGAYRAVLDAVREKRNPLETNILLAHCFVTGCKTSDSENPLYLGGSGEVPADLFEGFDYVALGHLHAPQKAGGAARYSGSPLKYSFDEANQQKGMTLINIEGKCVTCKQIDVPPLRDMRVMTGAFEELMTKGNEQPSDDYLFAELKDKAPVYMPVEQLRKHYKNLLGLSSDWMKAGGLDASASPRQSAYHKSTDETVFEQFMAQICRLEVNESDKEIFTEALKSVNRGDES